MSSPFFANTIPPTVTVTTPLLTSALNAPHQRALDDLLQAERALREKNESILRELRQTLLETAIRLNGERLEALRRNDPGIPSNWSPADWRKFFSQVSQGWGGAGTNETRALQLEQQVEGLKKKLAQAEAQLRTRQAETQIAAPAPVVETSMAPIVPLSVAGLLPGAIPALSALIADTERMVRQALPPKLSEAFPKHLNGGGRTGGDVPRAFQRYWIVLYLIGHWGLTVSTELEDALSGAISLKAGTGSLKRILNDLAEKSNILVSETLKPNVPSTSLKLYRLSPDGERLYQSLFHRPPNESEWSRLIRLGAGQSQPGRAVAILAFVSQARKRGWAAQSLPEAKDPKNAPDAWVLRGQEQLFVEIELGSRERVVRWQGLAALNDGRFALCAANAKSRVDLAGMCKQGNMAGTATDIETLVMARLKGVAEDAPLWLESW